MPHVPAPVAGLGPFEVGPSGLAEAQLWAEGGSRMLECWALTREALVTPRAFIRWKRWKGFYEKLANTVLFLRRGQNLTHRTFWDTSGIKIFYAQTKVMVCLLAKLYPKPFSWRKNLFCFLSDRVRKTILRSKTNKADVSQKGDLLKWDWTGHVCHMPDELRAKIVQNWCSETVGHDHGRPRGRWRDKVDRAPKLKRGRAGSH